MLIQHWHPGLAEKYADLIAQLGDRLTWMEWPLHLPWIDAINALKAEHGACILAHSYQSPEIYHGVADITGDSLALAQAAAECDADLIVMCGVHFMAETVAILAQGKTVLIPDLQAGCSLATSISAADVRGLKSRHPGVPVVSYINTTAEVKAESDACCTSSNAVQVIEAMQSERVIFLPDAFLGDYAAARTDVELILWEGRCEVHELFTGEQARAAREHFEAVLAAHPECSPEVLAEADFVGSTSAMSRWLERERPPRVALITECGMADNLRVSFPDVEFVRPCNLCPHMKRITLHNIHECLRERKHEVRVPPAIAKRARRALERMLEVGRGGCG